MKILFCNKYNFPFSGTEVYMFALMRLLRKHGHEVALFSMQDDRGEPTTYDSYFVPHVDFKQPGQSFLRRLKLAGHAIYSIEAQRRLRRLLKDFRPDLAHVRNIYHHLSPSILWELRSQGIPVVFHLNDFKLLCPTYNLVANGCACERPCTGNFWKVFGNRCSSLPAASTAVLVAEAYSHYWLKTYRKCVDHFIAPSEFVKQTLIEHGFASTRISVLPHFQEVTTELAPPKAASILYFGRLSPEKGVDDLVRAMEGLPQMELTIAGTGPQREELETLVRKLGLSNVRFAGHCTGDELQKLIASASFTVLPSRAYETLGKSILESFAVGRPVIGSDLGSRRELIQDGVTGLLYSPGNIDQLRERISHLSQHPQLAAEMGATARRWVQAHHSPESHYQSLMGLYEKVLLKNSASRKQFTTDRKPRVAFIGGRGVVSKYSGIESYYEEAGRNLASLGYQVTAYCRNYFTPRTASHNGMRVVRIPTIRSKHFETVLHTFLSTIHASCSDADIVHYHALGPALFSFLPRLAGKKTVVTVQGLDWQRKKWGRLASWVLRMGERAAVRLPNATMVVSKTLREYYRWQYDAETVYAPNGTLIRERRAPSKILEWGLTPNEYALFLGRFSPEKNCHLLVEAFERSQATGKLVLAGGSSHTDGYANQLRAHQSERIRMLDWVSGAELDELLTNAALFVLPSDLEGLSLALLDAMGAGVCVLTSDIPENREVVDDVGFTFRAGDVADLSRMLELLISDRDTRDISARRARERVEQEYLWPGISRQIGQVYDELCGRSTASPVAEVKGHAEKEKSEVA